MTKKEMIQRIKDNTADASVSFERIYGLPMGVGYDYVATLNLKNGEMIFLEVHAGPRAWAVPGHLRSSQRFYNDYKGGDRFPERYFTKIEKYWTGLNAIEEYFSRFKKEDIQEFIDHSLEA
jgi:hypothetical protein